MDQREFQAAFEKPFQEPPIDELVERFQHAFEASNGDTQTAMVVVNELLQDPIHYEEFLTRMRAAS